MIKKHFFRQFCLMALLLTGAAAGALAQSAYRITGTVSGKNGQGLPGVTVQVRNTNFATATEADGGYTLMVDLKGGRYSLDFSAVGYRSFSANLFLADDKSITQNAALTEDALKLDEVVVTGTSIGTTRKQLGNYISTVKADQLTRGATSNVLAALQGKTAGAQISQNSGDPAGGISVRLRGISTIFGSSEPLYIVDGVIVNNATNRVTNTSGNYDGNNFVGVIGQNRMSDINPADIERIEVLNGAAAAAIYGSRANAGVVQIFTKRGVSGAPSVNFSSSVMMSKLRKKVGVNRAPTKFGGSVDAQTQDILTPALVNKTNVTRYDYQDEIFSSGTGTDNNISVSGGKDKTKYYASANYFFNEGIVRNTDYRRFSFRLNLDQTISKYVSFNIGLNYINSGANEKPDGNSFFSPLNSINILGNFHDIRTRDALGNLKAVGERGRTNPLSVIEDVKQRNETNRILANAGIKIRPFKNFTIDYTLGIDNYSQNGTTFIPPFAYNVNTAFFGGGPSLDPTLNGYASTAGNTFFQINNELNATYQWNMGSDIGATTQVGYSLQYEKNRYLLFHGRGMAPFVQTVGGASTILPGADERSELSISGAYIQQNFRYRNFLYLTGALRMDGSSVFGVDQRNQLYAKLSGSAILSDMDFWKKMPAFWTFFKLRAAYGESGNLTGIGAYQRFNTYSTSSYLGKTSLFSSSALANENVKPERQKELEFGFDLGFLKNRINLQMNIYRKRVQDLLINRQIAPTTGFSSLIDNFGSLENRGIEIVLNATPVAKGDFKWNATLIYNRNRNKAIRIGQALTLFGTNGGAPVAILEGLPIGVFYGTFFAVNQDGSKIVNSAGIPLIEQGIQNSPFAYTPQRTGGLPSGTTLRKVIGDPNPDWTGSLVNEISYKKFNLRVQLDAVQGVDIFNADWRTRQGVGNGLIAEQEHNGQLPRGYIAGVYPIEQWRIDDGSFVKLREISLAWSLGKVKFLNDFTLSITGRNLVSWDNYKGYDPEVNAGGQSTILRGIDFGAVPIPRTLSFGISAKF